MLNTLLVYLSYPFVRYALIVGVLIALCSSLMGVTLVLKRFSFIGDGLSHVAFGAIAVASVLNLENDMLFVLPATVVCAVLLLRAGGKARIKGDAAIAMLSAWGFPWWWWRCSRCFTTRSSPSPLTRPSPRPPVPGWGPIT